MISNGQIKHRINGIGKSLAIPSILRILDSTANPGYDLFDINSYLKNIGLQATIDLTPSISMLSQIVSQHLKTVPYQNFRLHLKKYPLKDLSLPDLQYHAVTQHQGGGCYEVSEVMFNALSHLGYDVYRIPTHILDNSPFDPEIPATHNILLVFLNDKSYIVDVGYAYNSLRYPMECSFKKTEIVTMLPLEIYKLEKHDGYYQMNMSIKDKWGTCYRFDDPIPSVGYNTTMKMFRDMYTLPKNIPIRDNHLKIGKLTDTGRIGFHCEFGDKFLASKFETNLDGKLEKVWYNTFEEFQAIVKKLIGLDFPSKTEWLPKCKF